MSDRDIEQVMNEHAAGLMAIPGITASAIGALATARRAFSCSSSSGRRRCGADPGRPRRLSGGRHRVGNIRPMRS